MRFLFLFFLIPNLLLGQEFSSIDLWSKSQLERLPDEEIIDAFISLDEEAKLNSVDELYIKYTHSGKIAFRTSVRNFHQLKEEGAQSLELNFNKGLPLTNNSRFLSNYDSLAMKALFNGKRYTGKGVLIGIIDAGIDFRHPDFKNENGATRVKAIWDQNQSGNPLRNPSFGYGQVWDSADIDLGLCTHRDQNQYFGHGSNVSGIAAGNGNSVPDSIADYSGYAPEASIAVVSLDFNSNNFTEKVADAVEFLYRLADSLGMPCVINASLGTYIGSHDGLDFQAQRIRSLINAKAGRSMVCAAGNSGDWPAYHLNYNITSDTAFTYFEKTAGQEVFFELWADLADVSNLSYSISIDHNQNFQKLAQSPVRSVTTQLGQIITDTLIHNGNRLSILQTWRAVDNGRLRMQVFLPQIDSLQYPVRFQLMGTGKADIWSSSNFGWSDIVLGPIPDPGLFPEFSNYQPPDIRQSIVSSWACLDELITVGNIVNNKDYIDYSGATQTYSYPSESIAISSSRGPSRLRTLKPDLVAPGERSFSAGRINDLQVQRNVPSLQASLAPGGFHNRNGGTSMASPAVAGAIALLLERCSNLSQAEIRSMLMQSLKPRSGSQYSFGRGQLDVTALLSQTEDQRLITSTDTDNAICVGDSVQLSLPSGLSNIFWKTGSANRSITVSTPSEHYASFTNNLGCPAHSDTVKVEVFHPKQFDLVNDTSLCDGKELGIENEFSSYLWSTGQRSNKITPLRAGTYGLITTDSNGCKWNDSVLVRSIFTLPEPRLGNDTTICQGDMIVLYPGNFVSYLWNTGSKLAVINHRGTMSYVVTVTDTNGCIASSSMNIDEEFCERPLSVNNMSSINLQLFPNPSTGFSELKTDVKLQSVRISDSFGRTVQLLQGSSNMKLDLKQEAKGLYFVNLLFENGEKRSIKWLIE